MDSTTRAIMANQTTLADRASVWNSELGEFIDDRHVHLAQMLHDYKSTYALLYIPKKDRDATDTKPWCIVEDHPVTGKHIVRYLTELEMNDPVSVMEWIFNADLDRNRPQDVFQRIQNREAAQQLFELKRQEEELEDRLDLVANLAVGGRDGKSFYRHNGVTYRS